MRGFKGSSGNHSNVLLEPLTYGPLNPQRRGYYVEYNLRFFTMNIFHIIITLFHSKLPAGSAAAS